MVMIRAGKEASRLSGKLGGNIYSINGGTQLMRATPRRVSSEPSATQRARRTAFSILQHRYWQTILNNQFRDEWTIFAANHPTTNRLGQKIQLTGFSYFIKININRQVAGSPILLQPCDLQYI